MHDVFVVWIAGPRNVACARSKRRAHRMHAWDVRAIVFENIKNAAAHSRHDSHACGDIRTVSQLHADMRDGTSEWSHRKRNHIKSTPAHRSFEQSAKRASHVRRRNPIV